MQESGTCLAHGLWTRLGEHIYHFLESVDLDALSHNHLHPPGVVHGPHAGQHPGLVSSPDKQAHAVSHQDPRS